MLKPFALITLILFCVDVNAAGGASGGAGKTGDESGVGQTQTRRAAERFNIIDWIRSNQTTTRAQDAKYGKGGSSGSGPYPDFVLNYRQDSGMVTRDGIKLGTDTRATGRAQFLLDDLFIRGNKSRSLNIDLGVEGFAGQTTSFLVEPPATQQSHSFTENGGALLLRPFGRSSQDTSLMVKGGYMSGVATGLWANNQTQVSVYAQYVGAQAKLYLLPFLGLDGDYQTTLETDITQLQSKWKMQRFMYGAFLEIYFLNLGAYLITTETLLTNIATQIPVKEVYTGVGFTETLHF